MSLKDVQEIFGFRLCILYQSFVVHLMTSYANVLNILHSVPFDRYWLFQPYFWFNSLKLHTILLSIQKRFVPFSMFNFTKRAYNWYIVYLNTHQHRPDWLSMQPPHPLHPSYDLMYYISTTTFHYIDKLIAYLILELDK